MGCFVQMYEFGEQKVATSNPTSWDHARNSCTLKTLRYSSLQDGGPTQNKIVIFDIYNSMLKLNKVMRLVVWSAWRQGDIQRNVNNKITNIVKETSLTLDLWNGPAARSALETSQRNRCRSLWSIMSAARSCISRWSSVTQTLMFMITPPTWWCRIRSHCNTQQSIWVAINHPAPKMKLHEPLVLPSREETGRQMNHSRMTRVHTGIH